MNFASALILQYKFTQQRAAIHYRYKNKICS